LYHDGQEVTANPLGVMSELIGEKVSELHGWNQITTGHLVLNGEIKR